jgi:peroxiredoxin family protein
MEAAIYALTSKKIDEIFALFGIKKSKRIDPLITKLSGIGEYVACVYSAIPG